MTEDKIKEAYLQWLSTANDADFVTLETAWTAGYQAHDREAQERITELEQAIEQWKAGREAQAELIAKYAAELEAAKKDAERYRWLRDIEPTVMAAPCCVTDNDGYGVWGEQLDAAIDQAIKEKP